MEENKTGISISTPVHISIATRDATSIGQQEVTGSEKETPQD